ncbi:MAG: carbon-nitrogen family hydrolase [Opitutales bacterium]|nr:carbon-nitrogen family hydrolase [Opitutales bacterium]MCH8541289.1 hypothetical protein [Opitutales bacterium]
MKVFALQMDLAWQDPEENFRKATALLTQKPIPAGSLVVLPEMFANGFSQEVETVAEAAEGPTYRFLQEEAKKRSLFLLGGRAVHAEDGKGANEALLFNPSGELFLQYRKMRPFRFVGEHKRFVAGEQFAIAKVGKFTLGVAICYDLRFPEIFRQGVRQGVDFFIVPACWPAARARHWHVLLQARAIENQAYVLGVNRVGSDPNVDYAGGSLLVDPQGHILFSGSEQEEVLSGELDHDKLTAYRKSFPALQDMQ